MSFRQLFTSFERVSQMSDYKKLRLSIDTSEDVVGRVTVNDDSQWEAYEGMPSEFITEIFHCRAAEEALLYVFRSYIDNEEYWEERWAGDEQEDLARRRNNPPDIAEAYHTVSLMIVLDDSGHPIISRNISCSPRPEVVAYELNKLIDEIAKEKGWEGL